MFDYDVIWVGDRRVGYRRAGKGPMVVMLHGSPESSAALAPLQSELSQRFTTLAIDTPGNGISDPLAHVDPLASDYAHALAETFDALKIERAGVYGFHTGAGTAMEFALLYPDRVEALALDGYAIWTEAERKTLLDSYLVSFAPQLDGSHLSQLWARLEDQATFFPWNDRSEAARLNMDLPSLAVQHRRAIEWLGVGDHYIAPYRSAFYRRGEIGPDQVRCPTLIGATPPDPLWTHLDRIGERSAQLETEIWSGPRDHAFAAISSFLSRHVTAGPPSAQSISQRPDGVEEGVVDTPHGRLHWQGELGAGDTALYLHGAGESLAYWARNDFTDDNGFDDAVLRFSLPGHGLSTGTAPDSLTDWADGIEAGLDVLNQSVQRVVARGFGALIGAELQRRGRVETVEFVDQPIPKAHLRAAYQSHFLPELTPRWDGTHLITVWRWLRRRCLFEPWFEPSKDNAITDWRHVDAHELNARLVDVFRAQDSMRVAFQLQHSADPATLSSAAKARNVRSKQS